MSSNSLSRIPSWIGVVLILIGVLAARSVVAQSKFVRVSGQVYDGKVGPFKNDTVYWIVSGGVQIPSGKTLTIQSGTIVKFAGNSMEVFGTLKAKSVRFTSDRDDTGGDTNGDGGRTKPKQGDWRSLVLGAVPVGSKTLLSIPKDPKLMGIRLGVQSLILSSSQAGRGSFARLYRSTIR